MVKFVIIKNASSQSQAQSSTISLLEIKFKGIWYTRSGITAYQNFWDNAKFILKFKICSTYYDSCLGIAQKLLDWMI